MSAGAELSLEHRAALLPPEEREALLADLTDDELAALEWDWSWQGRPSQIVPIERDDPVAIILALAGRGWGKLLARDTLLPMLPLSTPAAGVGWAKLGDICVGDTVFDEQGNPCSVLKVFDAMPRRAYRLTFSDGTHLDACDEHQWVTWTHQDRKQYLRHHPGATEFPANWPTYRQPLFQALATGGKRPTVKAVGPEIRTTQQIVDTLRQQTARRDLNHCIPLTGPLQTPVAQLLVDPWVLGYWLGNGSKTSGLLTGHLLDEPEIRTALTSAGYLPLPSRDVGDAQKFELTASRLVTLLRFVGVLGNKHVPDAYLWASEPQRRALLAGLMDSDGYCDKSSGKVEFSSTRQQLADAVVQLARSLGEKPVIAEGLAKLNGRVTGPKWRVTWRPNSNPFTLTRKASLVRPAGAQALRNRHRMIVSAEEIPPVPMRCLTVDSPNSMFLVGEGMIPTHNTAMGAQWIREMDARWSTLGRDTTRLRIALVGRTSADVRDVMLEGPSGLMNIYPPSLRDRIHWTPTRRRVDLPGGAICTCFSADEPSQLRGPQFHLGWSDELAAYKQMRSSEDDATAWDNLRIAVRLGTRPQILATTTPKRVPVLRALLAEQAREPSKFLLRRGRTRDNRYLSEAYLEVLEGMYGGTALGRQELEGEMLDDVAGAMTSEAIIERFRVKKIPEGIEWIRVVSVDPSVAERPHDECGIVVIYISRTWPILKRHAIVVDDLSLRASPTVWGEVALRAAQKHQATIIAEVNQGANLVFQMLRQTADATGIPMPMIREVWSSKSKAVRAEPVGGAYARGRCHHLNVHADLESQMTSWVYGEAGYSPDRMDAAVQGLAAGLFPEASTNGMPGSTVMRTVADQNMGLAVPTAMERAGYGGLVPVGWDRAYG